MSHEASWSQGEGVTLILVGRKGPFWEMISRPGPWLPVLTADSNSLLIPGSFCVDTASISSCQATGLGTREEVTWMSHVEQVWALQISHPEFKCQLLVRCPGMPICSDLSAKSRKSCVPWTGSAALTCQH